MSLTHMQIKDLLDENRDHSCEGFGLDHICVKIAAIADLPSRFGKFHAVAFYNNRDDKEHAAFVHGDICNAEKRIGRSLQPHEARGRSQSFRHRFRIGRVGKGKVHGEAAQHFVE